MIDKLIYDVKRFDLRTILLHIRYVLKRSKKNKYDYFISRQRCYKKNTMDEISRYLQEDYERCMGEVLDLKTPKLYTEKIQWLKLYDASEQKARLADKYRVREWIGNQLGEEYLIPLLGAWDNFMDIDFEALPNSFVLKANHGSGMNIIVKSKYDIDFDSMRDEVERWLQIDYTYVSGFEMHYSKIKPVIIAEEYIEQLDGNLYDFKIHCFGGRPVFIQLIGDRNLETHGGYQAFYNTEWEKLDVTFGDYPTYEKIIEKPTSLDEMLRVARVLSKDFCYVRVDLYSLNSHVYFGEMTFTPASGMYPYMSPQDFNIRLGDLIQLPII